jgi:hypothetical protein
VTNRQKLKIIANVPLNVTLEDANGKESNSQYTGLEYRYNVQHQGVDSILYLPVQGAEALRRSGAQSGDDVQITKTMKGNMPVFTVRIFSDASLELPAPPPQASAQPDRFDQHMQQQPSPNGIRMLAPRTQLAAQPVAAASAEETLSFRAMQYSQLLLSVIDVAIGAEVYAAKKGRTIAFNEEDIRCMTATLFITDAKGGK